MADKILKGAKRIPIKVNGIACFLEPMTAKHLIEMQEFILGKRSRAIRIIYADEPEIRREELKALYESDITMDKILSAEIETLAYLMYIRCSIKDEISFDDFLGDMDELREIIEIAFGGDEKNVQAEQAEQGK